MKDFYLYRVVRDLTYTGAFIYTIYKIIEIMALDGQYSVGEMTFSIFLLIGSLFLVAEIPDEKKPRRFTVKIDGNEYQADEYSLNVMKKWSNIQMNGDEFVAIDDITSIEILRNPGHPDKKGKAIDLSDILKHAEEFVRECDECKIETSGWVGMTDPYKKKRTAPNKWKAMSEEQKAKISAALKKRNAEKKAQDQRIQKTREQKAKRTLKK
jgi:hypothetical protein